MNKRLQWLDAMRGFTMILVVAYHVALECFNQNVKLSASLPFLVLLRMPLFFFVSGFLACKLDFHWNLPNLSKQLWKKTKIQVIPAVVFLGVSIALRSKYGHAWDDLMHDLSVPTKGGYWFTWVLLQMFVVYYLASWAAAAFCRRWKVSDDGRCLPFWLTVWFVSVVIYATTYMPSWFHYYEAPFYNYSSLIQTMRFMQFFLLGNIVHRCWPEVQRMMDSKWFFPVTMIVVFFCCTDFLRWHFLRLQWTNLPRTLAMYGLVMLTVTTFRYYADQLTEEHRMGRWLQYIGTRTLDIYLLHFILMPHIPQVGKWLDANRPNFLVDILLSVGLGLIVIAACILISNVLRISPLFKLYFFGRKK